MRDLAVLFLHLLATVARLAGPGGARSVVAESVLVKHQLLILNRSRKRSSNLRVSDRMVAGLCALLMRPGRLTRSAIVLKPSTLLSLHRALMQRMSVRIDGSCTVEGCIRHRWRRDVCATDVHLGNFQNSRRGDRLSAIARSVAA